MAKFSIFVTLFFIPSLLALDPYTKFTLLNLPPGPIGPESVALDRFSQGPYAGVSDGRILVYKGSDTGFVDFAYTAPNRTKQLCDGTTNVTLGPTCGRPLGFSFNTLTGVLFIVDTFLGLFAVGPNGGRATLLSDSAGGVRFNFLTGIDVAPITGEVVFTDGSLNFDFRNVIEQNAPTNDSSGRLMTYNPITKQVKVLQDKLPVPIGPVFNFDSTFVLYSDIYAKRVVKYWLTGPKANTNEVLLNLPGRPIKIKRATTAGEFWVAVNIFVDQPPSITPFGYKFNSCGDVLLIKELQREYNNTEITVVQEYNDGNTLLVGSRTVTYVGIYTKS
ncbi:hypothetical protein ACH5RR_025044 [Cinchona calisaya]|uniref:Strictosidine synthase conserved region domain-containing protein n=1 Tax=Cinchona calisaya TaxID=153742 RepID=A0ABD2Z2K3_9GENT